MWFTTVLFFKSSHDAVVRENDLWEERIVLFNANDEAEAEKKAEDFGKAEEHRYRNHAGEDIVWKFDCVERVQRLEISDLTDGSEVSSRFLRSSEVESLKTPFKS